MPRFGGKEKVARVKPDRKKQAEWIVKLLFINQ